MPESVSFHSTAAGFAATYEQARSKFAEAAGARGLKLRQHVHPDCRGRHGEALAIDVARYGSGPRMLVLTSGTHGVEGFCGSGCQVGLLRDHAFMDRVVAAGISLLMIHAVNPYGFSHLRRVNEDNVDLNRNFIGFDGLLPENEDYAALHDLLLPDAWPPSLANKAWLAAWIATHGMRSFQAAVSAGQYQFADGLFFGGHRPTWSNRCLRSILREHATDANRIGWIDFHTGLGPRGHGEKIYAGRDDRAEYARACEWWGKVTSTFDGSSSSARVTGVACGAVHDECPQAQATLMALEFGTVPIEEVFDALRADHWLHNHPEADKAQSASIKSQMRDAFAVESNDWKEEVFEQARFACARGVECLAESPVVAA